MPVNDRVEGVRKAPDGGWGWVAVASAFVLSTIQAGTTLTSLIVLYADLIETFSTSNAALGTVMMVLSLSYAVSGITVGHFVELLGYRKLHAICTLVGGTGIAISAFSTNLPMFCFFFGFLGGFGFGSCAFIRINCVQHYFDKNRALALGLVVLGHGCSYLVYGALVRLLSNIYGWRGAVLLGAGMFLQCLPLSAAFRELPVHHESADNKLESLANDDGGTLRSPEDGKRKEKWSIGAFVGKTLVRYKNLFLDIRFCALTLGIILATTGMVTLFIHTPNRAVQSGIDKTRASLLVSILGGATLFGKLVFSIIANCKGVSTVLCFGLSMMLGGVVTAVMYLSHSFTELAVGAVLGGVFYGGLNALHPTVVRDIMGLDKFKDAFSLFMLVMGLAYALTNPYTGWLYDTTGRYDITFLTNGTIQTAGGCLVLLLVCRRPIQSPKPNSADETGCFDEKLEKTV